MDLYSYTRALRRYDRDLYAGRNKDGLPCVFRRTKRYVPVCEFNGVPLSNLIECKEFVLAITDNWTAMGNVREWGIDNVLNRVQSMDVQANDDFFNEMDRENDRIEEVKQRDMRNEMESFWSHERRRFAKATDHILTHSMDKSETRKRRKDRSIKNGNY